jgi:hypothetical protein
VLHRHRVAHFIGEAISLFGTGVGPIERVTALPDIVQYVAAYREQLQAAALAL